MRNHDAEKRSTRSFVIVFIVSLAAWLLYTLAASRVQFITFDLRSLCENCFAPSADNKWIPIYIGQGDLGDRIGPNHHAATCINSKGATHVHVHLNGRVEDRTAEESDLLARYTNAYKPNGCNDKIGG